MNPSKFKHGDAKGTLPRQESNSTNPNNLASPSIWDFWCECFSTTTTTTNNTSRTSRKKWLYIFKKDLVRIWRLIGSETKSVGSTSGINQYWYPKCLQSKLPRAKMLDFLHGGPDASSK